MKRSEMLKLMVEKAKYHDGSYLEPYAADALLREMEAAGMLAPYWIPEDDGYLWSDGPSGEPNGFGISISMWEPENET